MYPEIKLNKEVTIQPPVYTDTIKVLEILENPIEKTVRVKVLKSQEYYFYEWITVWEGPSYDAIGQWTDTDLIQAITQYYTN